MTAQDRQGLDYGALLQRLVDVKWLWQAPPANERCVQFSSYDRKSHGRPQTQANWYANHDRGNYLRVVARDGTKEHVLVDQQGPGCLTRLWSANPGGMIHFDVDGERVWSVDFGKLCRGEVGGVPEPLAGMRSRGGNVYLPMPFQQRLVVSCEDGDLYYLADLVQFADDTKVPNFSPELLVEHSAALRAMHKDIYKTSATWNAIWPLPVKIAAGNVVRGLTLSIENDVDRETRLDVLRRTRLLVSCGRKELVDVPVMDFFCGADDWQPWTSKFLGITKGGEGYCRFPMPFPKAGRIELQTDGDRKGVKLSMGLSVGPEEMPAAPLLFRADYHLAKSIPTRPFTDHVVLDAQGRGRFVGCSLLVRNPSRIWWGEGDEKVYVDGETFPSWFGTGTGTEDYFGYAWCDPTPFHAPLHAQIACQGPRNFGFTQLHRSHMLDSIPFHKSLRFELERWHWVKDINMDYATVAYWYGAPGATSDTPPMPAAADRRLEPLLQPKTFVADDALEGERLRVLSCSRGTHQVQDLSIFEEQFSMDEHRWWRDGQVGDAIVLALPVAEAGRYRVSAAFVTADDFAIVQVSLHGKPLGEPFDGFHPTVRASGPIPLGTVDLPAGELELRLEIVGKNEQAKPSHMVGLDYIKLEKQP